MKTTSRFAIAAAAGVLLGGIALSPAQAADLGGDCCADLEERVAELEATTVRKGNRKVSLTMSGAVGAAIVFWDDDEDSEAYWGIGNDGARSYLRWTGSAQIDPDVSAGFILEFDFQPANSTNVSNSDPGGGGCVSTDDDNQCVFGVSDAAFWIESKRLGRLTLGTFDVATGNITKINLGNHNITGGPDGHTYNNSFSGPGTTWGNITSADDETAIFEPQELRYDSPTLHGFTLSASIAESSNFWAVALRYAKEWNSIRVAAGIGYEECETEHTDGVDNGNTCNSGTSDGDEVSRFGWSGSVLHVPSGLFIFVSGTDKDSDVDSQDLDRLYVSAGVNKKFNNLGPTVLYGEWGDWDRRQGAGAFDGEMWGVGVVQSIDAAAMQLFLAYRNNECTSSNCGSNDEFTSIVAGGVINF